MTPITPSNLAAGQIAAEEAPASDPLGDAKVRTRPERFAHLLTRRMMLGAIITIAWLAMMAAVWVREHGQTGAGLRRLGVSPEVLLVSWVDVDQWLWIERQGRRIGLIHWFIEQKRAGDDTTQRAKGLPGYDVGLTMNLSPWPGGLGPARIEARAQVNSLFELTELQARLVAADQRLHAQMFTESERLYYRLAAGENIGEEDPEVETPERPADHDTTLFPEGGICGMLPLREPLLFGDAVVPIISRSETLQPGQRWTTRASSFMGGLLDDEIRITVRGRETLSLEAGPVDTWRLSERMGSWESTAWYDGRGRLVRRDLGQGLTLVQADSARVLTQHKDMNRPRAFPPLNKIAMRHRALAGPSKGKPLGEAALLWRGVQGFWKSIPWLSAP